MQRDIETIVREAIEKSVSLTVDYSFSVLGALVVLVIGIMLASAIGRWTRRQLDRIESVDETLSSFLSSLVRYALLVLVFITVLAQFGVKTTSILAALGAAGLAIGLALQGTLSNVASGVMLLVLRPFRIGEYIEAGGISGTVEEIGLFTTRLKRVDGLFVMAPNGQIWNTAIVNYSRNPLRRFELIVGISYEDDIGKAKQQLLGIAGGTEAVLTDPAPQVFVNALGDSAVEIGLRAWMKTEDYLAGSWSMTEAAKVEFDAAGLSIPYPQMDVHMPGQGA
ncbi:MAG: mechanosensitive ion channel domain-containing protein [Pseudomonadota bacterium]